VPLIARDEAAIIEVVRVPANALRLEGRLGYPEGAPDSAVVIAGPHPLLGGDLRNNVVTSLTTALALRGAMTLSFNYRGVGDSDGQVPDVASHLAEFWENSHVPDEPAYAEDLRAAVTFLRELAGKWAPLGLVGYSFGCSLLPGAITSPEEPLVLIAPTLGTHEYGSFADLQNPLLVIAPQGDFATNAELLSEWFDGLTGPKRIVQGRWDDHFFRDHESWLAETVGDFLHEHRGIVPCR
jgi:uncharacterized protein